MGIDYVDFYNLLNTVAVSRLGQFSDDLSPPVNKSNDADVLQSDLCNVENHAVYDIFRISEIVTEMVHQQEIVKILDIGRHRLDSDPKDLLKKLNSVLRKNFSSLFDALDVKMNAS